ncbi:MAG: lytic transglycosylase domain-containing protein [Myxococcota bacterium]
MRRVAVMALAALGVALLASGSSVESLPAVSAGPSAATAPVQPAATAVDARIVHVQESLRWRHTGLSEREIWVVAETLVAEADRHGLNPALLLAVLQVESGGYNFAVSSVGALGLMQLMPATGEELARELDISWHGDETLFDPVVNIKLGAAYLRQLSDRFGSWEAALAAYNWGPGRIDRRLRRGAGLPRAYAQQVLDLYDPEALPARS